VLIVVEDLNDSPPLIRVNALTSDGYADVEENLPGGSFVAHVSVSDQDTRAGGQVCTAPPRHKHTQTHRSPVVSSQGESIPATL